MYRDTDYLNYTDLNNIEERIKELTTKIQIYNQSTPNFSLKEWYVNDFPYIQEIDRIEKGIENLGEYWYKPDNWQESKIWLTGNETSQVIKSFSYLDINRWINNLNLIEKAIGDNSTIWNIQSYINWDGSSNLEWSDE